MLFLLLRCLLAWGSWCFLLLRIFIGHFGDLFDKFCIFVFGLLISIFLGIWNFNKLIIEADVFAVSLAHHLGQGFEFLSNMLLEGLLNIVQLLILFFLCKHLLFFLNLYCLESLHSLLLFLLLLHQHLFRLVLCLHWLWRRFLHNLLRGLFLFSSIFLSRFFSFSCGLLLEFSFVFVLNMIFSISTYSLLGCFLLRSSLFLDETLLVLLNLSLLFLCNSCLEVEMLFPADSFYFKLVAALLALMDFRLKLGVHHVLRHISLSLILSSSADIIALVHKLRRTWILSNSCRSCKIRIRVCFDIVGDRLFGIGNLIILVILLCDLNGHLLLLLHLSGINRLSFDNHVDGDIVIVGISITAGHDLLFVKNIAVCVVPNNSLRV